MQSISISLTEMPQFRRLVEFLGEVHTLADARDDAELAEAVGRCEDDLLAMVST